WLSKIAAWFGGRMGTVRPGASDGGRTQHNSRLSGWAGSSSERMSRAVLDTLPNLNPAAPQEAKGPRSDLMICKRALPHQLNLRRSPPVDQEGLVDDGLLTCLFQRASWDLPSPSTAAPRSFVEPSDLAATAMSSRSRPR